MATNVDPSVGPTTAPSRNMSEPTPTTRTRAPRVDVDRKLFVAYPAPVDNTDAAQDEAKIPIGHFIGEREDAIKWVDLLHPGFEKDLQKGTAALNETPFVSITKRMIADMERAANQMKEAQDRIEALRAGEV